MTDHRVLLGLYLVLAVWAVLMQYFSGSGHNNFDIYSGVARHFFAERPLFGPSPAEYADMNHYGPLFAFIIAPFVWLPHLMGVMLWVCATGVVFLVGCAPIAYHCHRAGGDFVALQFGVLQRGRISTI